ncbi:MAG TPA: aminodeoxychorismate synthase component I [Ohtaekwangia sp.]|nr:aminodeoxychorismate synthase component I [Ohtaekwangia sp.]
MTKKQFIETLNAWGAARIPFLFIIDFEFENPVAVRLADVNDRDVLYDFKGVTNANVLQKSVEKINILKKQFIPFSLYEDKFNNVFRRLALGDSYLTNLTMKTEIEINQSLRDAFYWCHANYKLFYKDQFLVFSPETFIKIVDNKIFSYPMKGTIDATSPEAAQTILADKKELAEHVTIVDLLRNDLSQVASNVTVTRFRYLDELHTNQKNLLQVSSEIQGMLPTDCQSQLGDILDALLPAGSVSGAPKSKTLEIIAEVEQEKRGYYTGVFGYYDGVQLDSAVMIRFIEKRGNNLFYRSGGGITTQSKAALEYQEMIDKVYLPVK